ncbi:sodium-dependent lysophosphatidylcholine symporter 1-like [Anneissia japonica]|uniref:sodium-dependent lysophosphatidylcholine symporter 1-like n=1 Tax=Anneissia japonica TaxID=1529436 RepID=UPI0014259A53|nr:sodium-dependent lysophosphatidylcholine symporter 1-like [Anneissia japonica]
MESAKIKQIRNPDDERTPLTRRKQKKLTVYNKLCFGVGGMPYQLTNTVIGFYISVFLLETAGVPPQYASVIILSGRLWDAFTDPIIGLLVTKTDTRFGKLKPWMASSAPFAVVSFFFLWYVPSFEEEGYKLAWYLLFYCVFQTLLSSFHMPFSALTIFITEDQAERDSATAYRMASEVAGTLLGNIIMGQTVFLSVKKAGGRADCSGNNTEVPQEIIDAETKGYMIGAGIISGLFVICAVIVLTGTTEKKPQQRISQRNEPLPTAVKKVLTFGPYIKLTMSFLFFSLCIQSIQGNLALFLKYSLGVDDYQYVIITILGAFPVLIAWGFLPEDSYWAVYVLGIVAGNCISVAQLLPWSMIPDVIDDFLLKTGDSYETIFYSFYVMFTKFAAGLSLSLSTLMLGVAGYETGACDQPDSVNKTLRLLVTALPATCALIGFLFLWLYPINEEVRLKNKTIMEMWRDDRDDRRRATVRKATVSRARTRSYRTPSTTLM